MQPPLFVKMSLQSWEIQISRTNKLLAGLSDEQLLNEIAPGRNTGHYILGHLVAVHDAMIPLLGLGERSHSELDEIFIKNPDKSGLEKPSLTTIRQYWSEVNDRLAQLFAGLSPEDWFQRHTAVSEADFEKEPHRNKLSVLINRAGHVSYHLGQLVLLK